MTSAFGFRRVCRAPLLVTFGVAAVVALTACGSQGDSGVASAHGGKGGGSPQAAGKEGNTQDQLLKFAKCMRDNGVDVPDPKPGEKGVRLQGSGSPEKAQQAQKMCERYLPSSVKNRQNDPKTKDQMLKLAKCMRENGVDVPDPGADGRIRIEKGTIDPESPTFKNAAKKCKQYRPDNGGGGG